MVYIVIFNRLAGIPNVALLVRPMVRVACWVRCCIWQLFIFFFMRYYYFSYNYFNERLLLNYTINKSTGTIADYFKISQIVKEVIKIRQCLAPHYHV